MPRTEQSIMTGWEFTLKEPADENFRPVFLPHDWAIDAPFDKNMEQGGAQGFRDRWGIGWYRKTYELAEKRNGYRYYLDFGGIYENSTVWVNEKEAGGHKYGYSSFRLDITEYVREGENTILIRVDNTQKPADRWYSGAGIYRTVRWMEMEECHLEESEIVVTTDIAGRYATVSIRAGINAPVKAVLKRKDYETEAFSRDGNLVIIIPDAALWSAEHPNLYHLELSLLDGERAADTVSMKLGIRKAELIPGKGFYVNGEKIVLKGVCVHQDIGCRGIAAKKELWKERLLNLKEMGCNAIRTAHHTFSEEFLDLCDELGFYVYEECFDKWTGGLYGRYFQTEWKKDVECMVRRDRNRACILIWGVGNEVENQGQDSMLAILRELKDYVMTMDAGRPVSYAMNPHFKRERNVDLTKIKDIQQFVDEVDDSEIYDMEEKLGRIEKIGAIVDILGCNYQEQWYGEIHERMPDKLILGTEVYQYFKGHEDQLQNFTEENPSLVPMEKEYVIGSMIWTGIDYLGESMGYPAKGWSGAVIRTNNERRPGYYILQSYWSARPMVHFSVMDYSLTDEGVKEHWDMPLYADHWHFPQFHKTVIPYMIASNCDEVALCLNGKRFYVSRPSECGNRVLTGYLPWQPGKVEAVGYRDGREVCRHVTVTPGPAIQLDFDKKSCRFPEEEGDELLLTVRAKDEDGNPYFRESSLVRFSVEGPAEIVAVDGGSLMSGEAYGEDSIHMYHGCASVVIRMTEGSGRVSVRADSDGMIGGTSIIYRRNPSI